MSIKMKKAYMISDDKIKIEFDFDWDVLAQVKSLPGRRFHNEGAEKYWTCPLSIKAVERLYEYNFELDENLLNFLSASKVDLNEVENTEVPDLKKNLYDFQKQGVTFIEKRNGRAILGDEMGLGKTIQALAWLHLHPELKPVVIICPAHLKLNWKQEIEQTLPSSQKVQVISGTDTSQKLYGDILIINYDILINKYEDYRDATGKKRKKEIPFTGWVDYLIQLKPKVLLIDEAHAIKSNSALRTKSTKKIARRVKHVLAITGTPIVNRPIEGFNILQVVDNTIFPDFWDYAKTFCGARHNGWGWDFSGATNKEQLHEILTQTVMIRRKKKEVLKELPDKMYSYVPMEIENEREYRNAELDFLGYLEEKKGQKAAQKAEQAQHLVEIEELKQLAVKGKMKQAIDWIRDYLNTNGSKLVVFAIHKTVVDALMKEFKDVAVKIDGSVSAENRDKAVTSFQNDDNVKLFVGNIQAAGTGITLHKASAVAFLELPWTVGELVQAEDRCHRIGQKDSVNVYYLLADGTIEQEIAGLLDKKRGVLDAILDGKEVEEESLITELIKSYKEKEKEEVKCY